MLSCLFSARISSQYSPKYHDSSCAYSHNSKASLMCLFWATIAALLYPVAAFAAKCIACSLAILGRRSTSCAWCRSTAQTVKSWRYWEIHQICSGHQKKEWKRSSCKRGFLQPFRVKKVVRILLYSVARTHSLSTWSVEALTSQWWHWLSACLFMATCFVLLFMVLFRYSRWLDLMMAGMLW